MRVTVLASLAAPHLPPTVALAVLRQNRRPDLERLALELARPFSGCGSLKSNHQRAG